MTVNILMRSGLMMAFICAPDLINSGTKSIHERELSAVANMPCYVHQPDLSVGTVAYHKGLTVINGTKTTANTPLRSGDTLSTAVDGFMALELNNGTRVTIQPDTQLRIACSGHASERESSPYTIGEAHTLGAIRG